MPSLLPLVITAHVPRPVYREYHEEDDGRSCSCVGRRHRFRPSEVVAVQAELGNGSTFRLAGVGYVTLPRRALALGRVRRLSG